MKKKSNNFNSTETLLEKPIQSVMKTGTKISNKILIFVKRIILSLMFISGMVIIGFGIQYKFAPYILGGLALIIVTIAFLADN